MSMNKSRVEAFTDAVVAIIMTIMILEFKTPETDRWSGIIAEVPYLFAYIVSFIFIAVAWYNHHYMFSIAKRITKKYIGSITFGFLRCRCYQFQLRGRGVI
ncbi:hypothetical protein IV81_GL001048 [Pediococcus stilesii]|uniref:DUF1211 domain-containing protein n=2 Tax=Pediococcus stilesii TaxID=331679 RepID=A0A0R2KZ15_9LACO|nr:hypothetical protein IV81_GL001048 [Pediococcus stilesii]